MKITTENKRLFQKAERICLRHSNGTTQFEVYHDRDSRNISIFECKSNFTGDNSKVCFSHGMGAEWITSIFRVARKDDEIYVEWYKNALNTDHMKDLNMAGDLVLVHINRPKKSSGFQEPLVFVFDMAVNRADNATRMIK